MCSLIRQQRRVASGDKRQEEITGKLAMVRDTRARDSRDTNNIRMAFQKESLAIGRNQGRERKVGSVPLLDLSANRGKGINKYLGNRTGAGGEGTRGEGCWECCNRTKKKFWRQRWLTQY